ncbi:uncharacterized protein LOC111347492 [Stylophora pistillata]|uniref:uncharacterized protein LOC111347492 n=1 Tax=Stylophora pistillata TaxID=50429 RepID=UPI000C0486FE|nr:uncharacterized protein LOC111347492 [Stylophora pistillata]
MAEARDLANARISDAQRLMAEASVLLKEDLDNARVRKKAVEELTKTLNQVHFASAIKLNVGGKIYKTTQETLRKDPNSMLCAMFSGRFELKQDEEDGAYFIDSDPELFRYILNYLRKGELHFPEDKAIRKDLLAEAKFYQVQGIIDELEKTSSLSDSVIVSNENHLLTLKSWLPSNATRSLLYRGTVNGKIPTEINRYCDLKGPTLVVIKSGNFIGGGFTTALWESRGIRKFKEDKSSYLFTLVNQTASEPFKLNAVAGGGIGCKKNIGPNFGTAQLIGLAVWPSNSRLCSPMG